MAFGEKHGQKKIYRGAYDYISNGKSYAEEIFNVFKDPKESNLTFESQLTCRTPSGEFLLVSTEFLANKDFLPLKLEITRSLGKESINEKFTYDNRTNRLKYVFECNGEAFISEDPTTPKFHIATPTAVTSVLFTKANRIGMNNRVLQNVVTSVNNWEYSSDPITKIIAIERLSLTSSPIKIKDKDMEATHYAIYKSLGDSVSEQNANDTGVVNVFLSKYDGIPYLIEEDDKNKIEIKYLNNLDENK
jgi:hypothetical protein